MGNPDTGEDGSGFDPFRAQWRLQRVLHGLEIPGWHRPEGRGWEAVISARLPETAIDRTAMGRLSKALAFICGKDHHTAVALRVAAETGSDSDVKKARALFLKLNPSDRRAALAMIESDSPP